MSMFNEKSLKNKIRQPSKLGGKRNKKVKLKSA